jgi:galactokinase
MDDARRSMMAAAFAERFGAPPEGWACAPGRVDLMGSHTDYNLGHVLTMAIDRDTVIAYTPRTDRMVHVASLNLPGESTFSLDDITHDPAVKWADYVRGVADVFQNAGYALTGFNGLIHSTVPFGSGLSSSAAIEVATGVVFRRLGGWSMDGLTLAKLTQQAENEFVGLACGILDQYTSVHGREDHVLLLDCRSITSTVSAVDPSISVMICNTRAPRELTGSEYDDRRAQCESGVATLKAFYPEIEALRDVSLEMLNAHRDQVSDVVERRCRFIIEEDARVPALAAALAANDRAGIRAITAASFAGARDLYEISVPAMEAMYDAMTGAPGALGARQAGAGFGGCMVAFIEAGMEAAFSQHVMTAYEAQTGITPEIYAVKPAAGAG